MNEDDDDDYDDDDNDDDKDDEDRRRLIPIACGLVWAKKSLKIQISIFFINLNNAG